MLAEPHHLIYYPSWGQTIVLVPTRTTAGPKLGAPCDQPLIRVRGTMPRETARDKKHTVDFTQIG
jgi:hypothetical protein